MTDKVRIVKTDNTPCGRHAVVHHRTVGTLSRYEGEQFSEMSPSARLGELATILLTGREGTCECGKEAYLRYFDGLWLCPGCLLETVELLAQEADT